MLRQVRRAPHHLLPTPPQYQPALVPQSSHSFSSQSLPSSDWRQVVAEFQRKANDESASLCATDVERVVHVCTANDRTREALSAVHEAQKRGVVAPFQSHMRICCSWARKGQAERSLAMMPELRDRFGQECLSLATPTSTRASVYDPLLSVFKLQGDWRSTHEAIAQMHKLGIPPTIRAFRVLMLTLAKAGQTDTLLTTVTFVERKFPSLWTDVVTLTAMCQSLVRVDEHQRVLDIYSKLDDGWIREQASTMLFNQFLLAAVRNEATKSRRKNKGDRQMIWTNVPVATKIFDCMQEAQVATPDDFTFATCMKRLENRGDWNGVLDLFDTMVVSQTRDQSTLKAPLINALSCAAAVRALHMMHEVPVSDQVQNAELHDATRMKRSSRSLQRKMKQDLTVVLEQIRTVDLRKIDHASSLIDTLDEFRLFTAARDTFRRVLDEGVIQKTPWRLKDGFEIDLHTFSRGVAKCAVVSAFDEITRLQQSIGVAPLGRTVPLQDLRIIVGLGKRSQTFMKPVLRQAVTDLLTKSSRPPLWPSMHPTNPGVLLVRHNALRKWLVKGGAIRYF